MKKSLVAAVAVAGFSLIGSTGAFAQAATQQINLGATVSISCGITAAGAAVPTDTATVTVTGRSVNTATVNPAAAGATGYDVVCNGSSVDMSVHTAQGGIKNTTPVLGFTNNINYQVDVGFAGATLTYVTTGATATSPVTTGSGAQTGKMTVGITPQATTNLGAGTYADQLTVTLLPQ